MHKYIKYIIILLCVYSSELNAQKLNLKIIGLTEAETKIINSYNYNSTHINYESISNEVDSLQKKIIKTGYLESEYSTTKKINDSLFEVQYKLHNKYETIEISYDQSKIQRTIINDITKESFNNYFAIPIINTEKTLNYINRKIVNEGFPFTRIKLSEIKIKNKKTLTANLLIVNDDKKRSLDNIVIKGYEKFPQSYLKRFLKITPQKTFNIETIKKKMNALNNLRFAEQTKDPEVLFTKDSTSLYIYLEKSQSNTFDGYLGFSTNENTNKIAFNGYVNLQLNNNFNYGESLALIYKSDENEQKDFEINVSLPYLFSSPLGSELSLKILKRDSTFTTVNQKASVFYQLNSKNRLYIGVEGIESNNLLNNELNTTISDYKSSLYNFKYTFENRKNFNTIYQKKTNINLELGFGNRETSINTNRQQKILVDAHHIFQLNNKNSFYTRFSGSILNSNSFLENELFRFGGINSIRGFQENSIIANKYIVLNTEYRYHLNKSIYAHTIIDFSNFENKIYNTKENLYGFGLGFGIITKAGFLKFNFANGKTEKQNFKFSNSKIHLSLVTIF